MNETTCSIKTNLKIMTNTNGTKMNQTSKNYDEWNGTMASNEWY